MSSLRNAVKRITHKERSQPTARLKLGLLEKKKDYKIRSTDYHRKQDELKTLKRKASERNPDEFYFGMKNAEVKAGRHRKLEAWTAKEKEMEIGPEAVRLMKTQDLGYVRMRAMVDLRKVERLEASLHLLGDATVEGEEEEGDAKRTKRGKHTIFVGSAKQATNFDVAEYFDTVPEMAGRAFNRPRKEQLIQMAAATNDDEYNDGEQQQKKEISLKESIREEKRIKKLRKTVAKARSSAYRELEARKKRIDLLKHTESHLVTEKVIASKGRKRKIKAAEDGKPAVYKFRRRRAR